MGTAATLRVHVQACDPPYAEKEGCAGDEEHTHWTSTLTSSPPPPSANTHGAADGDGDGDSSQSPVTQHRYRWTCDGVDVPGATSDHLVVHDVGVTGQLGTYRCQVTSPAGLSSYAQTCLALTESTKHANLRRSPGAGGNILGDCVNGGNGRPPAFDLMPPPTVDAPEGGTVILASRANGGENTVAGGFIFFPGWALSQQFHTYLCRYSTCTFR